MSGRKKIDLTGQRFGQLTVLREEPQRDKYGRVMWVCRCDCGNVVAVASGELRNGHKKSCGCLKKEFADQRKDKVAGKRFGRLTVLREEPQRDKYGRVMWVCRCDCGNVVAVATSDLLKGSVRSCGCLQKEIAEQRRDKLTGQRFGRLTVLREDSQRDSRGRVKWVCRCDCGNVISVAGADLKRKSKRSCGCLSKDYADRRKGKLTGQRFGRLTVLEEEPQRDPRGRVKWVCRCDCGSIVSVAGADLRSGNTKSCGCLRRGRRKINVSEDNILK